MSLSLYRLSKARPSIVFILKNRIAMSTHVLGSIELLAYWAFIVFLLLLTGMQLHGLGYRPQTWLTVFSFSGE